MNQEKISNKITTEVDIKNSKTRKLQRVRVPECGRARQLPEVCRRQL
mgnify:CR=1 FL=1